MARPRCSLQYVLIVISALSSALALAETRTVTLGAFQIDGRERYLPTSQLPASESFDLDLPAGDPTILQARIEIWPRLDSDTKGGDPCASSHPDREQYHSLAMTPVGDGTARALRAHVPPLQLGREFCFLVTRTRTVSPTEAKAVATWIVSKNRDLVDQGRYGDSYPAFETELQHHIEAGLKFYSLGNDAGQISAARRAAPVAATTFYYSPAAANYLQALRKRKTVQENLDNAKESGDEQRQKDARAAADEVEHAIASQRDAVATALIDAVTGALQEVRFDLGTPTAPLPASAATLNPNNFASVDAGVALGVPLGSSDFRKQFLPYVGLNLYSTAVERNVSLDELTGSFCDKYIRQRVSLTVGVTIEKPSSSGWTVKPLLLGTVPLIAVGYRLTQYTRVSIGFVFFLLASRNPVEDRSSLGSLVFLGYSIDFDVLTLLRTGLSKI